MADVENADGSTVRDSFKGIKRTDSVAIDPHKGLFLSYGLGAVLIKDVKAQMESHYYRASYMQDTLSATEEYNPTTSPLNPDQTLAAHADVVAVAVIWHRTVQSSVGRKDFAMPLFL
ncbi:MAG: hypothetical protein R2825_02540 [Saprospiraceae bacterium]